VRRLALLLVVAACGKHGAGVVVDGDWDEPAWQKAQRGQFADGGALARPSSEVRFVRGEKALYVALYAADEDIEPSDAFHLTVGSQHVRVDAAGHVTPAGVIAKVGLDEGTLGDAHDDDEEWVVEVALPPAPAGTAVSAARCDVPKDGVKRCGSWSGALQ
jgi:hypothetical protein